MHVVVLQGLAQLAEGRQQVLDQPGDPHSREVLSPRQTYVVIEEVQYHLEVAQLYVLTVVVL